MSELKDLLIKQQELILKHIFHKMYPSCCTDRIQVFENRQEWDEFVKINIKIDTMLKQIGQASSAAIDALEKQMPKKPRENYNWIDLTEEERPETSRWYCKMCDSEIKENYSFCVNCGQKLDWN